MRAFKALCALLLSFLVCLALHLAPAHGRPHRFSLCRNVCDFYFDGYGNGTIPTFSLVNSPHGPVPISPRVLYGGGWPVQVHASGPAILVEKESGSDGYGPRRLLQQPQAISLNSRQRASSNPAKAIQLLVETSEDDVEEAQESLEREKLLRYSFYVASASETPDRTSTVAPAFLYEKPLKSVEDWTAAAGRCMKIPLIKLRVYYRRNKFLYVTEGDGDGHFPEARRCVVFKTR